MAATLFENGRIRGAIGRRAADSRLALVCLCVGLLLVVSAANAAESIGRDTGFPVPRFVSVAKSEANLRAGPGKNYPILTVLQRRDMPVKIIDEYQRWRKIELHDGLTGWLHKALLSGRTTFLVTAETADIRKDPVTDATIVATVGARVIADLDECNAQWCHIQIDGYAGWIQRDSGWGTPAISAGQPR